MPTKCGLKDSNGYYCRWGSQGKKYYYDPDSKSSRERARKKADKQGRAARASGYEGSIDDTLNVLDKIQLILESLRKSFQ